MTGITTLRRGSGPGQMSLQSDSLPPLPKCRTYKWATGFSCKLNLMAITHQLHERQRFHKSPTSFPCDYAGLEFPRTRSFGDTRSTTSYLIVIGNNASSRASLHPDCHLPTDLWWAHSPGCPPPIKSLGRRSARPMGNSLPRAEERDMFFFHI